MFLGLKTLFFFTLVFSCLYSELIQDIVLFFAFVCLGRRLTMGICTNKNSMVGKTVLITGGNVGIGELIFQDLPDLPNTLEFQTSETSWTSWTSQTSQNLQNSRNFWNSQTSKSYGTPGPFRPPKSSGPSQTLDLLELTKAAGHNT